MKLMAVCVHLVGLCLISVVKQCENDLETFVHIYATKRWVPIETFADSVTESDLKVKEKSYKEITRNI